MSDSIDLGDGAAVAARVNLQLDDEKHRAVEEYASQLLALYHQRLQYSTSPALRVAYYECHLDGAARKYQHDETVQQKVKDHLALHSWSVIFEKRGHHSGVIIEPVSSEIPTVKQKSSRSQTWREYLRGLFVRRSL